MKRFGRLGLVFGMMLGAVSATGASAATYGFENIAGGATHGDSLAGNFSLDVTAFSATEVLIKVLSAVNPNQSYFIGGVFIDDDPGLALGGETVGFSSANSSTGVSYSYSSSNGGLPQGNLIGFSQTSKYLSANGNGNAAAVQPGEFLGFVFTGTLASVIAALDAGSLRFGLHVQGIGGNSDSFVNGPATPVPLPATGLMLLAGLAGMMGLRRKG